MYLSGWNHFSLSQSIWNLIFQCHTVTNGPDLRSRCSRFHERLVNVLVEILIKVMNCLFISGTIFLQSLLFIYISSKRNTKMQKKSKLNQLSAYPRQLQQKEKFFWRPHKSERDWCQINLFIFRFSVAVTLVCFSISLVWCASLILGHGNSLVEGLASRGEGARGVLQDPTHLGCHPAFAAVFIGLAAF